MKIRAQINEIENRKTIEKIKETKNCFFEKIIKIAKHLAGQTKKKRDKTQITKIRNENEDINTGSTEIKRIIKKYYKHLYANKLYNQMKWTNSYKHRAYQD